MRYGRIGFASLVAALFAVLASGPVMAEGDPANGEKVFRKCKACHVVNQEKNRVGPHLVGIIGRSAGAVQGFKYSKAMKESGITWTEENLTASLSNPRGFIKGNRMAFAGLKKEVEIVNVIAYLRQATVQ